MGILPKIGTFAPSKLFNNTLASCSLRNFYLVLLHIAHIDKSIILPIFVLTTFGYSLSVFFAHFKQ